MTIDQFADVEAEVAAAILQRKNLRSQIRAVARKIGISENKLGVLMPEVAKEKPQRGRVLAVGDGKLLPSGERATPVVKEGDRVLFDRYAGTEIEANDQTVIIMTEKEILAVIA